VASVPPSVACKLHRRMRRLLLIAAVLSLGLLTAGCGLSESAASEAEGEGAYFEVAGLTSQIQLSRYLNPYDLEDKAYLEGLPAGTAPPGKNDIWFGVWMRVKNYSGQTLTPTTDFKITDTEGNSFEPTPQSASNPFTYQPGPMLHASVYPEPSSAAGSGPIQGSLVLFRLKLADIPNRPLTLHIASGAGHSAEVQLDL
jgi:hypothetical protein